MGTVHKLLRAGVLTASDLGSRGEREDESGMVIQELLMSIGIDIAHYNIVPDDRDKIREIICNWADKEDLNLIVTTGGTGLGPRDITPDVTMELIDYQVPGIAEAMRAQGLKNTPMSMISRAVSGVRGRTLIINLPGSPRGVRDNLKVVLPVIEHSLELLMGEPSDHRHDSNKANPE